MSFFFPSAWSKRAATLTRCDSTAKDKEPVWKFRFNEAMKLELLHAVEVDEEMSALISEKQYVLPFSPFVPPSSLPSKQRTQR